MSGKMKLREALQRGTELLKNRGIADFRADARFLLCQALGKDTTYLLTHGETEMDSDDYLALLRRRADGEPLSYIVGKAEFMSLEFEVNPDVLIPRQDTETLVEFVIEQMKGRSEPVLLDLCTGSGCIAISLAKYIPGARVTACDISSKALEVAERNAGRNQVRVAFRQEDVLHPGLEFGPADLVVSNPPYIEREVIDTLQTEVKDYEPRAALDGGPSGMVFYNQIIPQSRTYLKPGGILAVEIGADQGQRVKALFERWGYIAVQVHKDYPGNDRVVAGIWAPKGSQPPAG